MNITIARMKKGDYGKTKAFFDVSVNNADGFDLTINGCRLVEGPSGLFLSAPSDRKEVDGETKYYPIVWFGESTLKKIQAQAVDEYKKDSAVGNSFTSGIPA